MAALIGVVSKVIGQVYAVAGNGARRAVVEGDRLYAGDTLDTGAEGAVAVHLTSGNELTLGRGSSLQLTTQLLSDHPPSIVVNEQTAPGTTDLTEVQQAQAAIAAGADPTQTLEATAAGPAGATVYTSTPAGDLGGGHSFVLLTETGGEVQPTVGFPTAGLGFTLLDPERPIADFLADDADTTPGVPPVVVTPEPPVVTPEPPVITPEPPVTVPPTEPPVTVPPVVTPPDNGVTFNWLKANGGDLDFKEADLPNGTSTQPDKANWLTDHSSVFIDAKDGLASLTITTLIEGQPVTTQVVVDGQLVSNPLTIVGESGNSLTITGFNPATGILSYSYTLSQPGVNNAPGSDDPLANLQLSDDFQMVAVDTDGDTASAWINITIVDDAPIATVDTNSVAEKALSVEGNVLTNDKVGADTNATPVSIDAQYNPVTNADGSQSVTGTYGTLTINSNGTYTYVVNADTAAFTELRDANTIGKETFTYTLTDGDGDTATATLTIDVTANHGVSINWLGASGGDLDFKEADLPNGTSIQPDKANWLTDHSSLFIDAKDGLASLNIVTLINGQPVTTQVIVNNALVSNPLVITGESGNNLTITGYNPATGVLSYSYTLDHAAQNNAPGSGDALANLQLSDDFQLVAVDNDGDNASAWINITIVDDAPVATLDTNAVTEKVLSVEGNVLTNDKVGADSNANPISIDSAFNPVTNADGSQSVTGTYGTLTINPNGTYTYVLNPATAAFTELRDANVTGKETFTYTLTDGDGDKATANLVIDVVANHDVSFHWLGANGGDLDFKEADLPNGTSIQPDKADWLTDHSSVFIDAKDGLASLNIVTLINGQEVTTQVVVNNALVSNPLVITGESGNNLTITGYNPATGVLSYSYTLDHAAQNNLPGDGDPLANLQLSDDFKMIAVDTDGDTDSAWINITIKDDAPQASNDVNAVTASGKTQVLTGDVTLNDKVGADTNATPVSLKASDNPGLTLVDGQTLIGKYGTLVLNGDGSYTYTVDIHGDNYRSLGSDTTAADVFTYTLTDGDGDSTTAKLSLDVHGSYSADVTFECETLVAQESNLPGGSTYTPGGERVDSSLTVNAPDGVINLTVGGIKVMENGVLIDFNDASKASITTPEGNIFTVLGFDAATGEVQYAYTMTHALDHSTGDGTSITETFTVVAEDSDGDVGSANFDIRVDDDTPLAAPLQESVTSGATGTNVLLIIDVSNSMNDQVRGTNQTRLDLAKDAIDKMLAQYSEAGDVRVQVTTFNNQTHQVSTGWVDVAEAIKLVDGLKAGGGTNYDYALDGAKAAYAADGKLEAAGTQTVSYFVSDGNPTLSSEVDHVTGEQSGNRTDTALGDGIDAGEEADWVAFLKLHDIKSYAIGIGSSPSAEFLNPIAYDGATNQNTNAVLVRDITELPDVLGGTVQGQPVAGSLTDGGGYGADGGFVRGLSVDGVEYRFDGQSTFTANSNAVAGSYQYNPATHEVAITTQEGGGLLVNLLTGQYSYTPPVAAGASFTETVQFTLSDTDGDLSSNVLTIQVKADTPLLAGADTVLTNIADSSITVPAAALLATATPGAHVVGSTTFSTGASNPGADFSGSSASRAINFRGSQQTRLDLDRSQFTNNAAAMSAALVVAGALGMVGSGQASDTLNLELKKGETVHLDSSLSGSHASIAWAASDGHYTALGNDGTFTATEDGRYSVQITNRDGGEGKGAENYRLDVAINYGHVDTTAQHTYTVADDQGHTATGSLAIHYQDSHVLVGTDGNDVIIGGDGSNQLEGGKGDDVLVAGKDGDDLYGNDGNDLLISGAGDDRLDGGDGNNTASYQNADHGVRVDLTQVGVAQDTGGAGHDTLSNIHNLIGSAHDDVLIGDANDNILIGGKGDDTLTGGGGSDTFKWLAGDTGHDTVTDFKFGNDTLDLSQLLQGENAVANSLENFLQFKVSGSGDSLVSTIEISAFGNDTTTQIIDLKQVDVASNYGVQTGAGGMVASGHDTATIISGMLSDHSLKADTV